MPVVKNDMLSVPVWDSEMARDHRITIHWSQRLVNHTADYYALVAKNKSQGDQDVFMFIAAEWYEGEGGTSAPSQHLAKIAQKTGNAYEFMVDSKFQYGQNNVQGDMRFVVYHDKGRKPYQHRFLSTTVASSAVKFLKPIANKLGYGALFNPAIDWSTSCIGDYLHDF